MANFFSSALSLILVFRKSDNLIYTILRKITIHKLHIEKSIILDPGANRWFTVMRSEGRSVTWGGGLCFCPDFDFKKVKKKTTKNEYSSHNVSILWSLKNLFCISSNLLKSMSSPRSTSLPWVCPGPTGGLKRPQTPCAKTLQNDPATPLTL